MKKQFTKENFIWKSSENPDFSRYPLTSTDFTAALSRMLKVSKCESEQDLERFLELTYGEIEEARSRSMIPAYYLLMLLKKCQASAKWIITGIGDPYLSGSNPEYNNVLNDFLKEIDLIMQLVEENKRVRKKILYLYGKESRFLS